MLRRRMRRRAVASTTVHDPEAPYAAVCAGLFGLPCYAVLRRTIDSVLTASALSLQLKLLVMAVIARALDCAWAQREVASLMQEHAVDAALSESAMTHLHSDVLTERENLSLRYARESVRYTPAAIQRYSRDIRRSFGETELIELIGVIALANAICRVSVLVEN